MRYYNFYVIPDDPDMAPRGFYTYSAAEEWAAGLCCSYDIRRC